MDFSLHESILIIVSVLFTAASFNLALYFGYGKKLAYLFFSFYCLFHCFKIYLKTFPNEQVLISSFGLTAYQLVYLSVVLGMLSLSTFLAHYFNIPYRKWFLGLYVFTSTLFLLFVEELAFIKLSLIIAIAQITYVVIAKRKGHLVLVGLLGFVFCVWLGWQNFLNYGYFVGVIFLIFSMVLYSSIELAKRNKEHQATILRASRLENQLIKSTIQPHFILNSLTSLQELIDSEPKKASEFVFELSKVFELFAKISEKKLVPINDELNLIDAYLEIMGVRKNMSFRLEKENLLDEDSIPPGVFLTLIENGLTHGYEDRKKGFFSISRKEDERSLTFSIFNDGNTEGKENETGTGMSYVISRLQESYSNKFDFDSAPQNNGWLSTIVLWK